MVRLVYTEKAKHKIYPKQTDGAVDDVVGGAINIDAAEAPIVAGQTENEPRAVALEKRNAEIAVILDNSQLICLDKADLMHEYFENKKQIISGQDVQNSGPGRPEGIIAKVAGELALPGKSKPARKKFLERALDIAGISRAAKAAARTAKLARYQSALLEIAGKESEEEQLQKVKEIVARKDAKKKCATGLKTLKVTFGYSEITRQELLNKITTFADEAEVKLLDPPASDNFTQSNKRETSDE